MTNRLLPFVTTMVCLTLAGCGGDSTGAAEEETAATAEAVQSGPVVAASFDFAHLQQLPAGVAGDETVVFVGQPLSGSVVALDRLSSRTIGALPPPPGGFVLPFIMHSIGPGRVAVLDAGGFPAPNPFVAANPTIYEYAYTALPFAGFSAKLVRTVRFSSVLIGFAEDFAHLDDGRYVVSDARLGAIWIAGLDGTIRPGIVPKSAAAKDQIPALEFCPTMPELEVAGIPFLFTDSALPGISDLATRDGTLFFHSSCGKGLYSVPIASLSDGRQPDQRAADIRIVSPQPANVAVEELLGLTFNPFDPADRFLYAADALQLRIVRVDVGTGVRQVVANDPRRFDFPSSTAFLPPLFGIGIAPLVVVSNQQERTTLTNDAVTTDAFVTPFIVAKIFSLE